MKTHKKQTKKYMIIGWNGQMLCCDIFTDFNEACDWISWNVPVGLQWDTKVIRIGDE